VFASVIKTIKTPERGTDVGSSFESVCYGRKMILQGKEIWIIMTHFCWGKLSLKFKRGNYKL
jgi:hypothetical protein